MTKSIVLFFFLGITILTATAQEVKIGYADIDYILQRLPSAQKLQEHLNTLEADLMKNYQQKETEFKTKYNEFLESEKKGTTILRDAAIQELQMLEDNLMKFQADIKKTLQEREEVLSIPVFKSIGDAIAAVGKEKGFTLVLNPNINGMDSILFADEKMNISDLVLAKLGVTPNVAANVPPTQK